MTLTLHFHPLSTFCIKALIALYENDTAFDRVLLQLGDPDAAAAFRAVWPMAMMPVLVDTARGRTVAEATVIVEYLDAFHQGDVRLMPDDPEQAWQVRMWDRVCDHYVQHPMQKIVGDSLRPAGSRDPHGVTEARERLDRACALLDERMRTRGWMVGDAFTLADCAAAPALFYADTVAPFGTARPALAAYLRRLADRPSVSRALAEASPYFHLFPLDPKPVLPPAAG